MNTVTPWKQAPISEVFASPPPYNVSLPRPEYTLLGAWSAVQELVSEPLRATKLARFSDGPVRIAGDLSLDSVVTWVRGDLTVDGLIDSPDRNVLLVQGAIRCGNGLFNRVYAFGPIAGGLLLAHELMAQSLEAQILFIGADHQPDLVTKGRTKVMELGKKPKKGCPPEVLDGQGKIDRFKVNDHVRALPRSS